MSSNSNKATFSGALIMMATAFSIGVSAQTSNISLQVNQQSTRQTETASEKKSAPPVDGRDLTAGPEEVSEINPGSEVFDPVGAQSGSTMAASDKWQFQFSPYFWLASLHGTGGVGNRTTHVDASFGEIFDTLKFALMGVFEARKGRFVSLTDIEYISIRDDKATPGPLFSDVSAGFKTFIFDQEVGYRLYDEPAKGASVDVLGGFRVWHVSTDLDFGAGILPATQIQGSRNWVDAIVGLRGKTAVSEKLFVTGKFDLGGGGSKFTWQLFAGGGYNINQRVALILGYRVLDVNYNKNNFIYDMNQRGPIMGLGFKF